MASKTQKQIFNNCTDNALYDSRYTLQYGSKEITGTLIPNRVFVGGISTKATEAELIQLFAKYGQIKSTKIVSDKFGMSKGYGFITYETEEAVRRLQHDANNLILKDRRLNIAPAIQKIPPYGFEPAGSPSSTTSSASSNMYVSSGYPFTYHNGMAFFSASQHYSAPPVALLSSPPPSQPQPDSQTYYPVVYGAATAPPSAFVGSAYSTPTILYSLPNTVPVFVGNHHCPYQSLTTVPNQPSEIVYNSSLPALPAPPMVQPPPIPQHTAIQSITSSTVKSSCTVPAITTDNPTIVDVSCPPQFAIANDLTPASHQTLAQPPIASHMIESQPTMNPPPYYNMVHDIYPVMAVNHNGMMQYCDLSDSSISNISSEDSSYEPHQSGHSSHEIRIQCSTFPPNHAQEVVAQHNIRDSYHHTSKPANMNLPHNNKDDVSDQHLIEDNSRYAGRYTAELNVPPYMHNTVAEYNSTMIHQNVATSVVYPVADSAQNFYLNSLYLGSHISPLPYSNYTRNENIPYANDRPPKYDTRNKKKYPGQKDDPPNIPKFPFYLGSNGYQSNIPHHGYNHPFGGNQRSYKSSFKPRNYNSSYNNNNGSYNNNNNGSYNNNNGSYNNNNGSYNNNNGSYNNNSGSYNNYGNAKNVNGSNDTNVSNKTNQNNNDNNISDTVDINSNRVDIEVISEDVTVDSGKDIDIDSGNVDENDANSDDCSNDNDDNSDDKHLVRDTVVNVDDVIDITNDDGEGEGEAIPAVDLGKNNDKITNYQPVAVKVFRNQNQNDNQHFDSYRNQYQHRGRNYPVQQHRFLQDVSIRQSFPVGPSIHQPQPQQTYYSNNYNQGQRGHFQRRFPNDYSKRYPAQQNYSNGRFRPKYGRHHDDTSGGPSNGIPVTSIAEPKQIIARIPSSNQASITTPNEEITAQMQGLSLKR